MESHGPFEQTKTAKPCAAVEIAFDRDLTELVIVTRARVTQVMNLLHLAPDIQEALLDLPRVTGREPVLLRDLQPIAMVLEWRKQRKMWGRLRME